jgi:hypothetical protein
MYPMLFVFIGKIAGYEKRREKEAARLANKDEPSN